MMLDLRFSTDYYLRVIELAIRDESRILVYNKKQRLLETWPINTALSSDQDAMKETIQKVNSRAFFPLINFVRSVRKTSFYYRYAPTSGTALHSYSL